MSWLCIRTLAFNTVREAVRSKLLYTLLFLALLLMAAGVLISSLSYVESARILQDIGLAAMRLFGVAIAIFVGVGLIHREVERRTVYTILSKPVSRAEFLLGKALGLVLSVWLQLGLMVAGFVAVSLLAGAPLGVAHVATFALIGVELVVVVALATLFSTFTSPMLAAYFTVGIWVVGNLTRNLRDLGATSGVPSVERLTAMLHQLLPDLESFDLSLQAVHGLSVTAAEFWLPVCYGAGYAGALLLLAIAVFTRRDFQ